MEAAIASRGFKLKHLIGPQTAHKIHPDSLQAIEQELAELGKTGRSSVPTEIDFTTYSLRYARNAWIEIEGLKEHWTESRIQAKLEAPNRLVIKTQGITRFNVLFDANQCPLKGSPEIEIDGMIFAGPTVAADGSWKLHLLHDGGVGGWSLLEEPDQSLRKRPGLQGPIDDAFYGPILFVRPTKPCTHGAVERWTNEEWTHAQSQWRKHYRGETPTIQDVELTPEMARDANLIVFGCPNANSALGKVISQLPIEWTKDQIRVGEQTFDPVHHVVVMIFPNPMNPQRYIVINSGFTFREYAYLNNARQIAMLPDWAVIDVNTPPNAQMPGKVVAEGFFNEQWQLIKKQ